VLATAILGCTGRDGGARTIGDAAGVGADDTGPAPQDAAAPAELDARAAKIDAPTREAISSDDVLVDDAQAAPLDAGPATCPHLFCEDFESGRLDPARWTVGTSGAHTVTVQEAKSAHGKFAAQFHAPGGAAGYDFIVAKNGPAQLRLQHFGRAYLLVTPKLPSGHTGLMFAASSGFPRPKYLEVAGVRGGWQLSYVALTGAQTGETDFHLGCPANDRCVPSIQMPVGVWTCVEWELNDQPDQIALTVDGKPIGTASPIQFNNQSTDLVGGFVDFGFGFYDWHPDANAFDVYYDDIALDTAPVGCL
jgi:hypothetical protein